MNEVNYDLQTVPVHVVNPHELRPEAPAEKPRDIAIVTQTFTLKTGQAGTVDSLVRQVLDRDPGRVQAIINVTSGTIYLCHSKTLAQAASADAAAVGGSQDGFLVAAGQYVPPLTTTDPLWAVVPTDKAAAGAQVSVIAEIRRA